MDFNQIRRQRAVTLDDLPIFNHLERLALGVPVFGPDGEGTININGPAAARITDVLCHRLSDHLALNHPDGALQWLGAGEYPVAQFELGGLTDITIAELGAQKSLTAIP